MELRQVRYFLALSRTLNFTHAAKECDLTQPALTNAIRKLEEEMGGPLIHRERANTHLTQLGQMVLPFLTQVYESSCAASRLAKEISAGERVPLNFGVSDIVPKNALLDPLRRTGDVTDGLEVHVEGGTDLELMQSLLEGDLHLIIVEEIASPEDRLRFMPIYEECFQLLVPKDHALAGNESVSLKDLADHPWIELSSSPAHLQATEALQKVDETFRPRHRTTRSVEMQVLVQAGFGVTLIGKNEHILQGLASVPLNDFEVRRTVGLAEARGRPMSGTVQSFARILRAQSFKTEFA